MSGAGGVEGSEQSHPHSFFGTSPGTPPEPPDEEEEEPPPLPELPSRPELL